MNFPEGLKYTEDHEWIKEEGDNIATVGITDFAQKELGDIVYVDINTVGKTLNAGEVFGTIEAVKTVSDLFMPVNGTVLEINTTINDSPEAINKDPYGSGWIIKIKLTESSALAQLLSDTAYRNMVD